MREELSSTCVALVPDAGETCSAAVDRNVTAGATAGACDNACLTDLRNGSLDLVGCSSRTETVSTRDDCIISGSQGLTTTANGTLDSDDGLCDSTQSYIEVADLDGDGNPINPSRAKIACDFNVRGGSIEVTMLRIRALEPVFAKGAKLVDTQLSLVAPTAGSMDANGNFSVPLFDDMFLGVAMLAGDQKSRAFAPSGTVAGKYDRTNGLFSALMMLVDEDAGIQFTVQLRGSLTNRAPTAVISAPATAECNRFGPNVTLDGTGSVDPDGDAVGGYYWYANDVPVGQGPIISLNLPLGLHEIRLYVADDRSMGIARQQLAVVDTTPPVVTVASTPECLWPNNHRLVRFDLETDLRVEVVDACDPAPTAQLGSITSSEPENGLGDGDTGPDVFIGPEFVCLRAERSGKGLDGRIYLASFHATDGSGNTAEGSTGIRVSHDSRPEQRCVELEEPRFVDEAICVESAPSAASEKTSDGPPESSQRVDGGQGCATSTSPLPAVFAIFILAALTYRRRRST